jgi:hypothetical protein
MFEGTLYWIIDHFASSVNAILIGQNVFAFTKDSHFRSDPQHSTLKSFSYLLSGQFFFSAVSVGVGLK